HAGVDNESRAGLERSGNTSQKCFHIRIFHKPEAVSETERRVVDRVTCDAAHVAKNEFSSRCGVRTAGGSGRLIRSFHARLVNKLYRNINTRHPISVLRQFKR